VNRGSAIADCMLRAAGARIDGCSTQHPGAGHAIAIGILQAEDLLEHKRPLVRWQPGPDEIVSVSGYRTVSMALRLADELGRQRGGALTRDEHAHLALSHLRRALGGQPGGRALVADLAAGLERLGLLEPEAAQWRGRNERVA